MTTAEKQEADRKALEWFAGQMLAKMNANNWKEHWSAPRHKDLTLQIIEMFVSLRKEVEELAGELKHLPIRDLEAVIDEAADVANFAMFIGNLVNRLKEDRS